MEFTHNQYYERILAKTIFSVLRFLVAQYLEKMLKMINMFVELIASVNITMLT